MTAKQEAAIRASATLIAVDTGGTFTDLAAFRQDLGGGMVYAKSLTTHDDLVEGIADCVGKAGVNLGAALQFKHGTTLVINTLIERRARVAADVEAGFISRHAARAVYGVELDDSGHIDQAATARLRASREGGT